MGEVKMDIGILNNLGYIEVIEVSIWLGIIYFGKCWLADYFRGKSTKCCKPKACCAKSKKKLT